MNIDVEMKKNNVQKKAFKKNDENIMFKTRRENSKRKFERLG